MSKKMTRKHFIKNCTAVAGGVALSSAYLKAFAGKEPGKAPSGGPKVIRGSWVQTQPRQPGDLVLVKEGSACEIALGSHAHSAIRQAAKFLAADIGKICGRLPVIVEMPTDGAVCIRLATIGTDEVPDTVDTGRLKGKPEAYDIVTAHNMVWLVGADFRGTAFAVYTLCERLGIDPLYLWSGYTPRQHTELVLKRTVFHAASPVFRYRGFFHDDEDILQRPFEANGYPWRFGDIPIDWYRKYFETALRLGMNMVAPYTRAHRRPEVQQCASEWGLYYTSHHYDILLSNPFGIERFNLAEKRRVDPDWDWFRNRKGMTDYWKGGVEENKALDAIWPVGLRGTDDHAYAFPAGTPEAVQAKTFREAVDTQVQLVKEALPRDSSPLFHFTLYTEMLERYLHDREAFNVPEDVIIVWPDDNNGIMRSLPSDRGRWKHGIYYHLSYFGGSQSKQSFHTVSPGRIAEQFGRIMDAGATEFMLLNVTELREFVMEARMIARLTWEGQSLPDGSNAADGYIRWWCREYFGGGGEEAAADLYHRYYDLFSDAPATWLGPDKVQEMLDELSKKCNGSPYSPPDSSLLKELAGKQAQYGTAAALAEQAALRLDRPARQFLFEQVTLGLLCNACTLQSALLLARALSATGEKETWDKVIAAIGPLEQLETAILKAERPPFEKWYRETWIRTYDSPINLHRSYSQLRAFIAAEGKTSPVKPSVRQGHNIPQAKLWTRFLEEMNQL